MSYIVNYFFEKISNFFHTFHQKDFWPHQALKNCKAVAIMDRCESYNGNGGPLGSEVTAGLFRHKVMIEAVNYIYGLAGRDFTVSDAVHVFEELADAVENDKEVEQFQYIRLR